MPDPADVRELLQRQHRRLAVYLRALLPGADLDSAVRDTAERVLRQSEIVPVDRFADWSEAVARDVAAEARKSTIPLPFSDDLFRQLADSADPVLNQCDKRPAALTEILRQLPPPERDLLRRRYALGHSTNQIAQSDGRSATTVARDLYALHESLIGAVRETLPDGGPLPPGGAADIGRLADQLLDGTISDDGRLILETLLLADAAAQVHYHRHAALAAELNWAYRGLPALPELAAPDRPQRLTTREKVITVAFIVAVVAVAAFVVWRLAG